MTTFNKTDLEERTNYEIFVLEFFRKNLFSQKEIPENCLEITLGNDTAINSIYSYAPYAQNAINESLNYFRPIAVIAAFKLQDMIAEWILSTNSINDWRFKQKIKSYNQLKNNNSLIEPTFFNNQPNIANAFWSLYKEIEKPRGTLIHKGDLTIKSDGTFEIKDRENYTTTFTPKIQAAYIRFCCIITRILLGTINDETYYRLLINNDLATLSTLHGVSGFSHTDVRIESLKINVPQSFAKSIDPYAVEIDFTEIIERAQKTYPSSGLVLSTEIVADAGNRTLKWQLPIDRLPNGHCEFREDDPNLFAFLSQQEK